MSWGSRPEFACLDRVLTHRNPAHNSFLLAMKMTILLVNVTDKYVLWHLKVEIWQCIVVIAHLYFEEIVIPYAVNRIMESPSMLHNIPIWLLAAVSTWLPHLGGMIFEVTNDEWWSWLNLEDEISDVVHQLTQGLPAEQKSAIETYFLEDASFIHPLCRIPSFSPFPVPFFGTITSRWFIWMIYRFYKILSPRIWLEVECYGRKLPLLSGVLRDTEANVVQQNFKTTHPSCLSTFTKYLRSSLCPSMRRMFAWLRSFIFDSWKTGSIISNRRRISTK